MAMQKLLTVVSLSEKSLLLKGFVLIIGKTNSRAPLYAVCPEVSQSWSLVAYVSLASGI